MKKVILPILIILGVVILTVIIMPSSEETPSNSTPTKVGEVSNETSDTDESAHQEQETDFKVGDVIKFGDRTLTVTSVERDWKNPNSYMKPDDGNEYVVVNVAIENTGKDTISVSDWHFEIQNASGVRKGTNYIDVNDGLPTVELIPSGKISGNIGFEVKSGESELKLVYKYNMFTDNVALINLD